MVGEPGSAIRYLFLVGATLAVAQQIQMVIAA